MKSDITGEAFIERIKQVAATLAREYPRYERRALQADPEHVMRKMVEAVQHKAGGNLSCVRGIRARRFSRLRPQTIRESDS